MVPTAWIPLLASVALVVQAQGQRTPDTTEQRGRICEKLLGSAQAYALNRGKPLAVVRGKLAQQLEGTAVGGLPEATLDWLRDSAITLIVTAETDRYFTGHPGASLKLYVPSGGTMHFTDEGAAELRADVLTRLESSAKANKDTEQRVPQLAELGEIVVRVGAHDLAADVYLFKWDLHESAPNSPRLDTAHDDRQWGPVLKSPALRARVRPRWERLKRGMRAGSDADAFDWIVLGEAMERADDRDDQEVLRSLTERARAAGARENAVGRAGSMVEMNNARRRFERRIERAKDAEKDAAPVRNPAGG